MVKCYFCGFELSKTKKLPNKFDGFDKRQFPSMNLYCKRCKGFQVRQEYKNAGLLKKLKG